MPRKTTVNGLIQWITTNLDLPLKTLRAGQREETVTVVGRRLCINQNDQMEKSRPVSLMHQIFHHAACVYVYIGDLLDRGP